MLEDDLVGTLAQDNQVKTLSARKTDREGHLADVVADALFNAVMSVRFRQRAEKQELAAIATIEHMLK